jgi:predicted TIM-barrel fold metal-dependent hydrolase
MGTRGVGKGLDDPALDPVWAAIEKARLVVFLHPHYGVDAKLYGERDNGHVLPLALGFPFETTIVS